MARRKYKLYASQIQDVPQGVEFSYIPPSLKYLLVYTPKAPTGTKPFTLVPEGIKMSEDERRWLFNCKVAVNTKAMIKNAGDYKIALNKYFDKVEAELKIEAEKFATAKKEGEGQT